MTASVQNAVATPSDAERERAPWQPLGFEKVAAADAQSGTGTTFDGTSYS